MKNSFKLVSSMSSRSQTGKKTGSFVYCFVFIFFSFLQQLNSRKYKKRIFLSVQNSKIKYMFINILIYQKPKNHVLYFLALISNSVS